VGSALGRAGVTVTTFWIWHLLLLPEQGDLSESWVEFLHLKTIRRVLLVLGRGVVSLAVFRAHHTDNFTLLAFLLGHTGLPSRTQDSDTNCPLTSTLPEPKGKKLR